MTTTTRMPTGLGRSGKALWSSVAKQYQLRVDETRILEDACRIADVISDLEVGMKGQKLLVKGSMGQPVVNPLVTEQRTHRAALANLLKQLKLPDDPAGEGVGESNQHRAAANSRWASAYGKTA